MSDTITSNGLVTSFSNTPQAKDDIFYSSLTGLTEDMTTRIILDVMANDLGGKAKVMYSLDDGIENEGSATSNDLLTRDATGADNFSRLGALIEVMADGRVSYTLTPDTMAALQSLGANQVTTDTFTYAIRLSSGALSWATVTVEIRGVNDAPTVTVTEVETGSVVEKADGPAENSGTLTTDGSFAFQDKDLTDSHTIQVALKTTDAPGNVALGELTAQITNSSTGDGTGTVSWSFSVAAGALDFLGKDEVLTQVYTVTLSDGQGGTVTKDITIQLVGTNDAPELTAPQAGLADGTEDTSYTVTKAALLQGFSDVEGDTLSVSGLVASGGGSVVDNLDGTYTVTHGANFNGPVTLSYSVVDGNGGGVAASLSYTLAAVNDAPELTGTQAVLADGTEDIAYTVNAADLLAGFSDVEGDTLSVSGLVASGGGSVVDNLDGTYTVTHGANFNGPVTLSYSVVDGNGGGVAASLSYTLAAVNDAPELTGTQAVLADGTEDIAYTVSAADLLAGFSDVEGDTLSVSGLVASGGGSVVDNLDGTYTVTHGANFNGPVTLSYSVVDGNGGGVAASLSYTLAAVNDAPELTGTQAVLADGTEDIAYTVNAADLLAGFSDVEGDTLSVSGLVASGGGSVVDNLDGTYTVTHGANFNGPVTLSYSVVDGNGGGVAASLSYTLAAVNDAPELTGTQAVLADGTEDIAYTVSAADLLAGFSDVEGDTLSVSGLVASGGGSVVDNLDGTYTVTHGANFNGPVTLSYSVVDGNGGGVAASLSYTLAAVNDAPELTGTQAVLADGTEDIAYTVNAADLLAGFSDVEGDTLSVSGLVASGGGSVVDNLDGTYTVTHGANFNGPVTLSYSVVDGNGGGVAASLSYTLAAVNDAPELTGTQAVLADGTEDIAYTVNAADLLAGFSDVEGDTLSVSGLVASGGGSVVDNLDGTYTVTHGANFNGPVTLSYSVVDGNGGGVAASLSYTLAAVNDAPELTGTQAVLADGTEDIAYTVSAADLLAGFSDVEGDTLSVSGLVASGGGSVVDNLDGTYTVTHGANFNGPVTLSYSVVDGNGGGVAASLSYTLAAVNDAPELTGTQAVLADGTEDIAYTVSAADLLAGFSDVEGDTLSVSGLVASGGGSVVDNLDGTYTVTHGANFNGPVTLSYSVVDGNGGGVAASLSYTLAAVNDAPAITSGALASVDENAAASTVIYTATGTDVEDGGIAAWSLSGTDAAAFSIGSDGALRLLAPADYETKSVYQVNVVATDSGGQSTSKAVTVQINNLVEAPVNAAPSVNLTSSSAAINEIPGIVSITGAIALATINVVDDGLGVNTLALTGPDAGYFTISGGQLFLKAGVSLDYENKSSYSVTVTVNDPTVGGNPDGSATFTLTLNDVAESELNDNDTPVIGSTGSGNNDVLIGNNGDNTLNGGNGNDTISGLGGTDTLNGENQDDVIYGGAGNDVLSGGNQTDLLYGGSGDDQLTGGSQNDTLYGGSGADVLNGSEHDDLLIGGFGADKLFGDEGNDTLRGSADNDILSGGKGNDLLFGDGGADTFKWTFGDQGTAGTPAFDTIKDFAAGDTLDIKDLLDSGMTLTVLQDGNGTTVNLSSAGSVVQSIQLDFYTAETAATIQAKLVDDGRYSL